MLGQSGGRPSGGRLKTLEAGGMRVMKGCAVRGSSVGEKGMISIPFGAGIKDGATGGLVTFMFLLPSPTSYSISVMYVIWPSGDAIVLRRMSTGFVGGSGGIMSTWPLCPPFSKLWTSSKNGLRVVRMCWLFNFCSRTKSSSELALIPSDGCFALTFSSKDTLFFPSPTSDESNMLLLLFRSCLNEGRAIECMFRCRMRNSCSRSLCRSRSRSRFKRRR